jgi:glycosyltransferase involved in cell wall biosynthesis
MKFTVAICTWNGASSIGATLESFSLLNRINEIDWELLIVDNNSTDNSREICEVYSDRLPIRIVTETKQGHSNCRNRAVESSLGEFIAWTDDDVIVDPGWLSHYDLAVDQYPSAAFWGGTIRARFEHTIPRWIRENWDVCAGVFAERDLGAERFEIRTAEQLPYGANFVTRRCVQEKFRFDTRFGRSGSSVRGFDEIDVLSRMLEQEHRGYWIPEASLEHVIPPSRTTLKYIADYFEGQGQTWVARDFTQLGLTQIKQRLRHHEIWYWLTRLCTSRYWFPHWVQASNLRGQRKALELKLR